MNQRLGRGLGQQIRDHERPPVQREGQERRRERHRDQQPEDAAARVCQERRSAPTGT